MIDDYRFVLARDGGHHWWPVGMRRITWAMLGPTQGRLLDVGCGPGWDLKESPASLWGVGVDRDPRQVLIRPFVLADAGRLPFPQETFDLVLALDLLEQRGVDPIQALCDMRRILHPGGRLLARVPAHPWLGGPHDRVWGGARRYTRPEFAALIESAGLSIRRLTYANSLLFAPAAAGRLLARAGLADGYDLHPLPGPINRLLRGVLTLEARWLRRRDLPMGLSLVCLAEA